MFEAIRKHSKFVMILLFLLIIPSFIFVGIDQNYFSESSPTVARVDGHEIKQSDWDNAHRMESDQLRAANPEIDAKLLDSPQARYATLERMVRDRVLVAAAQKMHMVASDAQLVRSLQQIPAIAALKRADGTLDAEAYRALVGAQGMTPEGFEANLRSNLSLSQVMGSAINSSFVTDSQVKLAMDALYQRREVQVAQFKASDFASKVKATPEELQAYYKAHPDKFQQAEQASVEYVVLDSASVQASMVLNEDDLRTYYQENLSRLAGQEERRASHILINATKDASAADRTKARERFLSGFVPAQTRHIAVAGGRIGFVVVKPEPNALLLDHLYIHPESQGLGIGAMVLGRIIDEARLQGLPLRVGALRDSDANRFYLRHGFKLVGQEEFDNYYLLSVQ